MRTITINQDTAITIEALTRRQIEALNQDGIHLSSSHIDVRPEKWDAFTDSLLNAYLPQAEAEHAIETLKDAPKTDYRRITLELIAETWGSPDETKNSNRSGGA